MWDNAQKYFKWYQRLSDFNWPTFVEVMEIFVRDVINCPTAEHFKPLVSNHGSHYWSSEHQQIFLILRWSVLGRLMQKKEEKKIYLSSKTWSFPRARRRPIIDLFPLYILHCPFVEQQPIFSIYIKRIAIFENLTSQNNYAMHPIMVDLIYWYQTTNYSICLHL